MLKKPFFALLILSVFMLLSACQGEVPVESDTVGTVCRDALLAFESNAPVNPLTSLSYRYGQASAHEIADSDALNEIYSTLLSIPLRNEADDPGTSDANIVFSFARQNGAEFTVHFVTQHYFALYETANAKWKYYEVPDPSLVRYCGDLATAADSKRDLSERPIFGDMFALDITKNDCASIDLDGDGQNERLYFDFIDNGDEAYGALELSVDTADKSFQMGFYPAERETTFACGVPYEPGRSLLLITTDAEGGWPSCLFFITVKDGRLMQYKLENVEISNYDNGVITLSDTKTVNVAQMKFEEVQQ